MEKLPWTHDGEQDAGLQDFTRKKLEFHRSRQSRACFLYLPAMEFA